MSEDMRSVSGHRSWMGRLALLLPLWALACSAEAPAGGQVHGEARALVAPDPEQAGNARLAERESLRRQIDDVKQRAADLRQAGAPHARVDELEDSVVELNRRLTSLEGLPAPLAAHPEDRATVPPAPAAPSQAAIDAYLGEKAKYDLSKPEDVAALAALKRKMLGR